MPLQTKQRTVALTGGTGYLGALVAAALLLEEKMNILALVRDGHDMESFLAPVRSEIETQGEVFKPGYIDRIHLVNLPALDALDQLDAIFESSGVDEIVHCAGCLDYFNQAMLEAVNVGFTQRLLERSAEWGIRRFVYISTAFSSGYTREVIREELHGEPEHDPTDYTRTKRLAEWLVAQSGIPYLIIRPSIVIGDSRDGHYSGKQYGVYQLWSAVERLLCRAWNSEFHTVGNQSPVSIVHQDAFQNGFIGAYRMLPDNSIFNLVSDADSSPSLIELWQLLLAATIHPRSAYFYSAMSDIPLRTIPSRQRALLALASVNLEIASHPWRFENTNVHRLREQGVDIPTVTLQSVGTCLNRFVEQSSRIQEFRSNNNQYWEDNIEFHILTTASGLVPAVTGSKHVTV